MQLALVRFYRHFPIGKMQDCSIQRVVAVYSALRAYTMTPRAA